MPDGGSSFGKIMLAVGCGVVLAVVALLGVCTMCVGGVAVNTAQQIEKQKEEKRQALRSLEIQDLESERNDDWITIRGRLHNAGSSPVTFVKVAAEFTDSNNAVIDTAETYAVGGDALPPGQSRSFKILQQAGRKTKRYSVHVVTE